MERYKEAGLHSLATRHPLPNSSPNHHTFRMSGWANSFLAQTNSRGAENGCHCRFPNNSISTRKKNHSQGEEREKRWLKFSLHLFGIKGLQAVWHSARLTLPKSTSLLNISLVSEGINFKGLLKGVMMHSFRNDYFKSLCFMEGASPPPPAHPIFIAHDFEPTSLLAFRQSKASQ